MVKATFSLEKYTFNKVVIDLSKKASTELSITFEPSGEFNAEKSSYKLILKFLAHNEEQDDPFVAIECEANFIFQPQIAFEEIPTYFYRNAIALIFPYIRAFVSTVTLQANIPPIMLPTMNLSNLEIPLKESTRQL